MRTITRVKNLFGRNHVAMGDGMFQSYYGNLIAKGQDGGPSAQEARRDFENIRGAVGRIIVY
jgi:hypothetical protein